MDIIITLILVFLYYFRHFVCKLVITKIGRTRIMEGWIEIYVASCKRTQDNCRISFEDDKS